MLGSNQRLSLIQDKCLGIRLVVVFIQFRKCSTRLARRLLIGDDDDLRRARVPVAGPAESPQARANGTANHHECFRIFRNLPDRASWGTGPATLADASSTHSLDSIAGDGHRRARARYADAYRTVRMGAPGSAVALCCRAFHNFDE